MRSALKILPLLALSATIPSVASAHHSFAMFDLTKNLSMQGVVKEFSWTNPHVWLTIVAVDAKGAPEEWGFEGGPTALFLRSGWHRDTLKPGDKISLKYHPMKNGSHAGSLDEVTLADGKVMPLGIQGAKPGDAEK